MASYPKIDNIDLKRLNNVEFLYYMNEVANLLPVDEDGSAMKIGLPKEFVDKFRQETLLMLDSVRQSRSAVETPLLAEVDTRRVNLLSYIIRRVEVARKSPVKAEREAGGTLYLVTKEFEKVIYKTVNEKTADIEALTERLQGEKYAGEVSALGLLPHIVKLEEENAEYLRLAMQRLESARKNHVEPSASIRSRLTELYEDLAMLGVAYNIIFPTEESDNFIRLVNNKIANVRLSYKRRKKRKWEKRG